MTDENTEIQLPGASLADAYEEAGKDNFQGHLILLHPGSPPALPQDGKSPKGQAGHYFASDTDFGPTVDVLLVESRWHALLKVNGIKTKESYNRASPIYKEIKQTVKDGQTVEPKFGISHLVYLPKQGLFLVFHPNTGSSRKVGYTILMYGTPISERLTDAERSVPYTRITRLSVEFVSKVPKPFFKPVVTALDNRVFEEDEDIILPDKAEIDKQLGLFLNPVKNEPKVTETTGPER